MKYKFDHINFNKFSIFEDNKLEGRSYHIPFASLEAMNSTDYLSERYNSDMITMLNGKWGFKFFKDYRDMPDILELGDTPFGRTMVPSCWQFDGIESPVYVNQRYEINASPPRVTKTTPVAVYTRFIELDEVTEHELITFLGVCSCLELHVNGEYVGYSEGSHNTAEFDISKYLVVGSNEIVCLVYKWCNGTFLECQDMFRHNGIFRDVYLTHYRQSYIADFVIEPNSMTPSRYELYLGCNVISSAPYSLIYTLRDGDKLIHSATVNGGDKIRLMIDGAKEWSAEVPNLYNLTIELIDSTGLAMCVRRDFGLKREFIRGNVLIFNDKAIKLKGVNHHDTNEAKGFCMNYDDYMQDLISMKECNVNAIRMSHYPPDPTFIMMCEHHGIYVVDEADIETHGMNFALGINPINNISHNKIWIHHYWDRVYRMFARDKNSVAVVLWSLGNEAGGYNCQDYCYDKLRELSDIPIHYEAAVRTKRFAYDVISEMYTSSEKLEKYAAGTLDSKFYDKPFMLCEYAHAMGVGPGDLDKYWEIINKKDSCFGAFVWEWKDHAILHDENSRMPACDNKYTYGGDHGEAKHDGNFCVDGLLYPDGTFHTGALSVRAAYSPMLATKVDNRYIKIVNKHYFIDSSYMDIKWAHYVNGVEAASGVVDAILNAGEYYMLCPNMELIDEADNHLIISYINKKTGKLINHDNITMSENIPNIIVCPPAKIFNTGDNLRVQFNNGGNFSLSQVTGLINAYKIEGIQLINKSDSHNDDNMCFMGNIYRACIDNYVQINKKWTKKGLDKSSYKLVRFNYEESAGTISTVHNICSCKRVLATVVTNYVVSECGCMTINANITTNLRKGLDLPKFGMTVDVPDALCNVEYYGLGDTENYIDMNNHAVMGIWSSSAADMFENYIKPQDNGNRGGTRWLTMTNDDGVGLTFTAVEKPFNFSISPVSLATLAKAKHQEDIIPSGKYNVNIDAFVRGVGSNACGPDTRVEGRYVLTKSNPLSFTFHVRPMLEKSKRD